MAASPVPHTGIAKPCAIGLDATLSSVKLQALHQAFENIAHTRMADMPMNNSALQVVTVGFELDAEGVWLEGILLTPWCMNLLRLPLSSNEPCLKVGRNCRRTFGNEIFEFIGNADEKIGGYETCSLFSPVLEFATQAAALETAAQVLHALRDKQIGATAIKNSSMQETKLEEAKLASPLKNHSRRGFLLGSAA